MKCIIVLKNKQNDIGKYLSDVLISRGFHVEILHYGSLPGFKLYQNIIEANPDFIITIDLTGFDLETDTDDIAFINLTFPSLNFISKDADMVSLKKLGQKLSIAMFFYCETQTVYDFLMEKSPEIPYLKLVKDWEEAIEDALKELS